MQFSDRIRIESGPLDLYEPYGSTTCETPFTLVNREKYEMQFSDRVRIESGTFNRTNSTDRQDKFLN